MAGRGQVSWLPGMVDRAFPELCVAPVAGAFAPAASFTRSQWRDRAGFRTGLPLTTDRMYAASLPAEASHGAHTARLGEAKASSPTVIGIGSSPLSAMRALASSCSSKSE